MNNLTLERNLVVHTKGTDPVPGHYLVVYRKGVFYSCLAAGERLRRFLTFGSPDSFIAYAVPDDQNLRHHFSRDYWSRDQAHSFWLRFGLEFYVCDPKTFVDRQGSDPLHRLEKEIAAIAGQTVRDLDWHDVKRGGNNLEEKLFPTLVAKEVGNLVRARRFAKSLGIEVRAITVDRQLSNTDIPEEIKIEEYRAEKLDQELRFDIESHEKNFERNQRIGERVAQSVADSSSVGVTASPATSSRGRSPDARRSR